MLDKMERASKMNEINPGQLKAILVRIIQISNADRIEIYPLDDDLVQSKIVKEVYKKHLHGLLFKLINASHFERVSRPQAGSNRAKLVIRRANTDPIPPEMHQFMMEQIQDVMTKSNGREAAKDIRLDQDKQHLEERQHDYDARKSG